MTLDAISQQSRIQATRETNISEFGLDVEQDLLRAVTGAPSDPTLGIRLTGKDALQATVGNALNEIPQLLAKYLELYGKEDFKTRFPWVEQIHEVNDPVKKAELDIELVDRLKAKRLDRMWLAIPEMMDWEGLAGIRYRASKVAPLHSDMHVSAFLESLEDPADLREYTLKQQCHIRAIGNDNDAVIRTWTVYRCLYCEVSEGSETYLLNNGRWFRIAADFVERINEAVDRIPAKDISLPEYSDKSEAAYCQRAVGHDPENLALMDQKLISYPSLPTRIEFCDIYSRQRQLIHLKRYSGSSTLSHLFAQATVSARLFSGDVNFRLQVNNELPASHRLPAPEKRLSTGEYEIVYGIISHSRKKLVLPFFSRVNLKNAYSNLRSMGYRVAIAKIEASAR
jgi:uncharacterized protein (TIGR04141 family)